ncbi:MAG TPA: TIR domain-containing protein, partial [Ktedonobacteraceae bacterium]|nr:TIR domain-containing protein [Ktedonobacteraceae bacterium]
MAQENPAREQEKRDFFISYAEADTAWAEWIGLQLEQASLTVALQAWDLRPGMLRVPALDHLQQAATRTLLLLSPASLSAGLVQAQWAAAQQRDPAGEQRTLIPIRVETCEPGGLLGSLVPIDLVNRNEEQARARLLEGIQDERSRSAAVPFPGQRAQVPFPGAFPPVWNVPPARNPAFTGREEELRALHERLHQQHQAAISQPQSISGLGGVGKTQLVVEYAYRHRGDYTAVLWVRADTTDTLTASYNELATLLALPERTATEQDIIVRAVQTWLRLHTNYLLIFDNADTPDVLVPFLPTAVAGHVLLTTRAADLSDLGLGLDDPLALPPLTPEEGAHLLLQRAGMLAQATPEDHAQALTLSRELGGLPLALDQAGAYVRKSRLSLAAYQQRYQQHHARLLNERYSREHPAPVATTWDISFRAVAASHPAAADL